MLEQHPTELDRKSTNSALIAQSDNHDLILLESGYSKFFRAFFFFLRMLFFFPISIGELVLRGMLKGFGEPKNIVAVRIFDFFSLIFWPQRLIDQRPLNSRYHAAIRIANFLILTTLVMFAFPPLAGVLGGAAALSAALAYLAAGFSALIAFCIVGVLYTTVFQYFNRSDVAVAAESRPKPYQSHQRSLHNSPEFTRLKPTIFKYFQLSLGIFLFISYPLIWMGDDSLFYSLDRDRRIR